MSSELQLGALETLRNAPERSSWPQPLCVTTDELMILMRALEQSEFENPDLARIVGLEKGPSSLTSEYFYRNLASIAIKQGYPNLSDYFANMLPTTIRQLWTSVNGIKRIELPPSCDVLTVRGHKKSPIDRPNHIVWLIAILQQDTISAIQHGEQLVIMPSIIESELGVAIPLVERYGGSKGAYKPLYIQNHDITKLINAMAPVLPY